jgi:hypothetical protein
VHLLVALIFVDILWLVIIMPFWKSQSGSKNKYWESLSGAHTFALILAFLELVLKGALAGLMFLEYKKSYPEDVNDLFKISYQAPGNTQLAFSKS